MVFGRFRRYCTGHQYIFAERHYLLRLPDGERLRIDYAPCGICHHHDESFGAYRQRFAEFLQRCFTDRGRPDRYRHFDQVVRCFQRRKSACIRHFPGYRYHVLRFTNGERLRIHFQISSSRYDQYYACCSDGHCDSILLQCDLADCSQFNDHKRFIHQMVYGFNRRIFTGFQYVFVDRQLLCFANGERM